MNPLFQHRHYSKIAEIIATLPPGLQEHVAEHFAVSLSSTNAKFSIERFKSAAMGAPVNGRDKVR